MILNLLRFESSVIGLRKLPICGFGQVQLTWKVNRELEMSKTHSNSVERKGQDIRVSFNHKNHKLVLFYIVVIQVQPG